MSEVKDFVKNTIKAAYVTPDFAEDRKSGAIPYALVNERLDNIADKVLEEMGVKSPDDFYRYVAVTGDCLSDAVHHQLEGLVNDWMKDHTDKEEYFSDVMEEYERICSTDKLTGEALSVLNELRDALDKYLNGSNAENSISRIDSKINKYENVMKDQSAEVRKEGALFYRIAEVIEGEAMKELEYEEERA